MRSPPRRLAIVIALLGFILPLLPAVPAQAQNAAT